MPFAIFVLLQVLDLVSTVIVLAKRPNYEGNPIMRLWMSAGPNPIVMLILAKAVVIAYITDVWRRYKTLWLFQLVMKLSNILYTFIAINNMVMLYVVSKGWL